MASSPTRHQQLAGSRARIINLVRRTPLTAAEIAAELGMTYHAVRLHLIELQREGMVRVVATRGSTRPANVYDIVAQAEAALSRAYVPFVANLTQALAERLSSRQRAAIMRDAGRRMAASFDRPRGTLGERAVSASALLQQLGAPNEVVQGRTLQIRSSGCLLSEAIHGRSDVCQAMAAFLSELMDADVRQCCDRTSRPRCCFEIRRAS